MADERSTITTHTANPNQLKYDWAYYDVLLPSITGRVLDIGCGVGMFAGVYGKKEEVTEIIGLDKFEDETDKPEKMQLINWMCPEKLPVYGKFDTIVSTEFIEHIEREQLEPLLEQIVEMMDENSVFVGSTPNKISPTTNPFHLYEYTLPEQKEIFEKYFSRLEMWDNGQYCTVWKASL